MTEFSRAVLTGRAEGPVTARQVARDGRSAPGVGFEGMPAYESEHRRLLVMESMIVFRGGAMNEPLLLPWNYRNVCARAPDGLAALHDDPDALWSWRPIIYSLGAIVDNRLGSQIELEYRVGLAEAAFHGDNRRGRVVEAWIRIMRDEQAKRSGRIRKNARKRLYRAFTEAMAEILSGPPPPLEMVEAREKADRLLLAMLAPQQRIDYLAHQGFYVRGRINRLYEVRVGNGFAIVDPTTHEQTVSFCLHPDEWIPHADVALATKLGIEAGTESEAELLSAANPTVLPQASPATAEERVAWRLERRYLAGI